MPHRIQTFDSNGPNVKIRGNAYQVFERYVALAREAASSGDRIAAENLYQHAEHYFRIMNANGEGNQHGHAAPDDTGRFRDRAAPSRRVARLTKRWSSRRRQCRQATTQPSDTEPC